MPEFEQFMPAVLVGERQQHWRAVSLSLEMPWFAFVYAADYEGQRVAQTTLVAWESTLVELLKFIPAADHLALSLFEKEQVPSGAAWVTRQVDRVWAPTPAEASETGILLLRFSGETRVRDVHMIEIPQSEGRELLFEARAGA